MTEEMKFDWDHIYLLSWYDQNGKAYLTTWEGDLPIIAVVVTGARKPYGPPLWRAPVPAGCELHEIPTGKGNQEYAKELGGVVAIGWYIKDGLTRYPHEVPLQQPLVLPPIDKTLLYRSI
jgi:hypothetical protein